MTQLPGFLTATGYDCSPVKHKMKRMTVDPSQSGCGLPSKGCCAPAAAHTEAGVTAPAGTAVSECPPEIRAEMVDLPGGTFLMGTDYEFGFPGDGEGPVHSMNLRPFAIDKFPVTNRRFREFVRATGYCTEAEHFGWSFVFWAHIPASKRATLIEDTVSAAPWWCKVSGAKWDAPEGPGSALEGRDNHPAVHVSWTSRRPSLGGLADACPQRRSGNTRPAVVWCRNSIRGETSFVRTANIAATSGRASFRATIRRKMAMLAPVPWTRSLPTAMAYIP